MRKYCECKRRVRYPRNKGGKKKWVAPSKNDHELCGRCFKPFSPTIAHWQKKPTP